MKSRINSIGIYVIALILLTGGAFYAAKTWVYKIEFSDQKKKVVSSNEFVRNYYAYLELQQVLGGADPGVIKKMRYNKKKREAYSKHYLNQVLIEKFARKRRLVNMRNINIRARRIMQTVKQMMIVKAFVKKIIEPKIQKVSNYDVKKFYNRYKNARRFRQRIKGMPFSRVKKYIRMIIYRRRKSALTQKYLTRLRERAKIQENKAYFK